MRFLKWLKNLFCSCFPWFNTGLEHDVNDPREADQLLVSDSPPAPHTPLPRSASSAALLEALLSFGPVKLSEEESERILSDARIPAITDDEKARKNAFIESLSKEQQKLAYDLIMAEVNQNITFINRDMTALVAQNPKANQLQVSWHGIRRDFQEGDLSDRSILPSCRTMKEKKQFTSEGESLLDNIMNLFSLCKNLLNLSVMRRIPKLAEMERAKNDYLKADQKERERAQARHEKICHGMSMPPDDNDADDALIAHQNSRILRKSK
jgi:hypothetical protein